MGDIRVGTASWTDRTLIASGWYPHPVDTPAKRLRFYAQHFPLVEMDASYYALPAERTATLWAERTPPGFTFNVKAFSLFTGHPTRVAALPADLRRAVEALGKDNVYLKDVPAEVTGQAWDRFSPRWPRCATRTSWARSCCSSRPGSPLPGPTRITSWLVPGGRRRVRCASSSATTPGWPSATGRRPWSSYPPTSCRSCVDMPQGYRSSVTPVLAATADLAVIRFHGHSEKWDSRDIHERFGYRYTLEELAGWAPRIRDLAGQARTTHVVFNNCYRDYAQTNARELAGLLANSHSS